MPEISFTTYISAPQHKVWEIMTDHERYGQWSPAKKVTYQKEGNPDKRGKGAIRVFHAGIGGILKVREEITEYKPPKSMSYRLLSKWPIEDYESEMELKPKKGEEAVTQLVWESEWENRLPKWLGGKLIDKTLTNNLKKFAECIKADAETTPHNLLNPDDAPTPAAKYSLAALSNSPSQLLITSGIVPDKTDGTIPKNITEQAEAVWETILKLLKSSDMQITDILSITTYVVKKEAKNLEKIMEIRDKIMDGHLPASTLVIVPRLANKRWKLEISITASC